MTEDEALDALAETLIVRTRTGIVLDGDPLFRTAGARELAERARTFLRDHPDVAATLLHTKDWPGDVPSAFGNIDPQTGEILGGESRRRDPLSDLTEATLTCIWCDWDGRTSVYWRGRNATWVCPRCGAVHEIEEPE